MQRQSFYDNQAVDNTDLNAISGNAEDADKAIAKEAIGYGITSGMSVIAVGGQMRIGVNSGTLIDKTGQRCAFTGLHFQDVAAGAVGPGQEQWIAVFAKVGRRLTAYEEDPSGGVKDNTNYTVQAPIVNPNGDVINAAQLLHVVRGTVAAVGSAARPALDSEAILVCDLYVGYGQTDYAGDGVVDFQRSELLRRIEMDESERASGGNVAFHLVRQLGRGTLISREYISHNGGWLFTVNAEYVASQGHGAGQVGRWKADDYAAESRAFSIGGSPGGGGYSRAFISFYVAGGTRSAPWLWAEWTEHTS